MVHVAIRGNGFLEIQREGSGAVVALWNLDPRLTEPVRINGQLAYKTLDGQQAGQPRIIPARNVIHIPWNSWNGIVGQSPISCLRETLGLAASMAKFTGRAMVNNGSPIHDFENGWWFGIVPTDKIQRKGRYRSSDDRQQPETRYDP